MDKFEQKDNNNEDIELPEESLIKEIKIQILKLRKLLNKNIDSEVENLLELIIDPLTMLIIMLKSRYGNVGVIVKAIREICKEMKIIAENVHPDLAKKIKKTIAEAKKAVKEVTGDGPEIEM